MHPVACIIKVAKINRHSLQLYSQSQSYITTDSQSVSKSWCRAQSGTFDHIYFFFFFFFLSYCPVIWGRPL
jgi:hypothetical protein